MNFAVIAGWLFSCSNIFIWSVLSLNSFLCLSVRSRRQSFWLCPSWLSFAPTRHVSADQRMFRLWWMSFKRRHFPSFLMFFLQTSKYVVDLFSAAVNILNICLRPCVLLPQSCPVLVFRAAEWTGLLCGGEAGLPADSVCARRSVISFSQWCWAVSLAHGSTQAAAVHFELSRSYGVFWHRQGSRLQCQTGGVRDVFLFSCSEKILMRFSDDSLTH